VNLKEKNIKYTKTSNILKHS